MLIQLWDCHTSEVIETVVPIYLLRWSIGNEVVLHFWTNYCKTELDKVIVDAGVFNCRRTQKYWEHVLQSTQNFVLKPWCWIFLRHPGSQHQKSNSRNIQKENEREKQIYWKKNVFRKSQRTFDSPFQQKAPVPLLPFFTLHKSRSRSSSWKKHLQAIKALISGVTDRIPMKKNARSK